MQIETLHDNEWLSLRIARAPEHGVNGYVYSHESRCQGRIVAILPYRDTPERREYLVKSETTPCWGLDQVLSAITGGYEGGDIADDAVREMLEETGYEITADELIPLGESYASKSADTVYTLYSVNLTGCTPGEAIGDGTRIESESAAVWLPDEKLLEIRDPQVSVMYLRLEDAFPLGIWVNSCHTPELRAEVDRLRAEVDRLRAELDGIRARAHARSDELLAARDARPSDDRLRRGRYEYAAHELRALVKPAPTDILDGGQ